MKRTYREFNLTKKNANNPVTFLATELDNGMLIGTNGLPMAIGDELTAAGFTAADLKKDVDALSPKVADLVLRVGDNRGHLVERREQRDYVGEAKAEEKNQNAFLKSKGYTWEKKPVYFHGPGEMDNAWVLRGPDGELAIDVEVDISGESVSRTASLKSLLTDLGYYGNEAKIEAELKAKERKELRRMRSKVDAFVKDSPRERATSDAKPIRISSVSRNRFKIDEDGIFYLVWNGSDGDNWSLNNDGNYISYIYSPDADIAACIVALAMNLKEKESK